MNRSDDQAGQEYRSMTRNMVLVIVVFSVGPLILISAITRHYFQISFKKKVLNYAELLTFKHRQVIENFLTERLGAVRVQAKSSGFIELSNEDFLKNRLAVLQEEYGASFVDLGVVDASGVQVAYAGPFRLHGADYSKADWFRKALQKDYFVSDVFLGLRRFPHLVVCVRQVYQGSVWILRATIDFESFKTLVENMGRGDTGLAFILNKDGEFQTKVPSGTPVPTDAYVQFLNSAGPDDEVKVLEKAGDSGKQYLYLMTRLNHGAWALGHVQSAEEVFADLYAARQSSIFAFVVGMIAVAVGGGSLARGLMNHFARARQEKRAIQAQLVETGKLASLGELAAGVAHEINNPVGIMVQEAGWLQDLVYEDEYRDMPNLGEFKQSLTRIQVQGKRCRDITHQLLSFARRAEPAFKQTQLNEMIKEVVDLCERRARYGNVRIHLNLSHELPTVQVSPTEIQQVLMNIINNSLDALESREGAIDITSRMEGSFAVVDIGDNGPGVPEANLKKLFEPFFTTKPVGRGTGLGLSICYGIVKKMGGEIKVDSEPDLGTTFHIYIPLPEDNTDTSSGDSGNH
jgi:two-component system, NtrC family, sensor kinase